MMRGLPFALTSGPLLTDLIREARRDSHRNARCVCCGAAVPIHPDRQDQRVHCPTCARWQRVRVEEETPWRLTPAAAELLGRTRRWLRRL